MTSELIPARALTFAFDAVIGTVSLSLRRTDSHCAPGSIVSLQIAGAQHAVTLLCQGVPFARGELVDIEDTLGVRITDWLTARRAPCMNSADRTICSSSSCFFLLGLLPLIVDDDHLVHEVQHRADVAALGARRAAGAEQSRDLGLALAATLVVMAPDASRRSARDRPRRAAREQSLPERRRDRRGGRARRSASSCSRIRGRRSARSSSTPPSASIPSAMRRRPTSRCSMPAFLISEISSGFEAGLPALHRVSRHRSRRRERADRDGHGDALADAPFPFRSSCSCSCRCRGFRS